MRQRRSYSLGGLPVPPTGSVKTQELRLTLYSRLLAGRVDTMTLCYQCHVIVLAPDCCLLMVLLVAVMADGKTLIGHLPGWV